MKQFSKHPNDLPSQRRLAADYLAGKFRDIGARVGEPAGDSPGHFQPAYLKRNLFCLGAILPGRFPGQLLWEQRDDGSV